MPFLCSKGLTELRNIFHVSDKQKMGTELHNKR